MANRTVRFKIYRYDPDKDAAPYMQDVSVELEPSDVKLLDAIVKIKALDDSLSIRRSCRIIPRAARRQSSTRSRDTGL